MKIQDHIQSGGIGGLDAGSDFGLIGRAVQSDHVACHACDGLTKP